MSNYIQEEGMHKNQQLFIQNNNSFNAQQQKNIGQIEDIPCWTDSQRFLQPENEMSQIKCTLSKIELCESNDIQAYPEQNRRGIELNYSTFNPEKKDKAITSEIPNDKVIAKVNNGFTQLQNINRKSLAYDQTTTNQVVNNNEFDSFFYNKNQSKNVQNKERKKPQHFTGNAKVQKVTGNIKLMIKLKSKISSFFRNFTLAGRTKYLNHNIRKCINDKSDIFQESNSFTSFFMNCSLTVSLTRYLSKHNIPLIDYQSYLGILVSLFFIIYNSLFLLVYSLIVVFDGFEQIKSQIYLVTSFVWVIEVLTKFNTSIFKQTKQVQNRIDILIYYLKYKIIFDLFPLLLLNIETPSPIYIFIFLKILNLLSDLKRFQKFLCMTVRKYYVVILINLIFKIFLFAHIIACMWYLIAKIEIDILNYPKSWVDDSIGNDGVWWKLYFASLYWALTLMTTGSNIAATTLQTIFITFNMIFTTIAFGYLLNVVGFVLETIDQKDEEKRRDTSVINEFMRKKNISQQLQQKVNLSLEHYYDMNFHRVHEESQQIMQKISQELRVQVTKECNKQALNKVEFLNTHFSTETKEQLYQIAKEEYYLPNQIISNSYFNSEPSMIYIISGSVEILNENTKDLNCPDFTKKIVEQGQIYGQRDLFGGKRQRDCIIRSQEFTSILRLTNQDLVEVIKDHERDYQLFCQIRDNIFIYESFSDINSPCKICGIYTHQKNECPKIHIHKQYLLQKISYTQTENQSRQEYERATMNQNKWIVLEEDSRFEQFQDEILEFKQDNINLKVFVYDQSETQNEETEDQQQSRSMLQQENTISIIKEDHEIQHEKEQNSPCLSDQYKSPFMNGSSKKNRNMDGSFHLIDEVEQDKIYSDLIIGKSTEYIPRSNKDVSKMYKSVKSKRVDSLLFDSPKIDYLIKTINDQENSGALMRSIHKQPNQRNLQTQNTVGFTDNNEDKDSKLKNLKTMQKQPQQQRRHSQIQMAQLLKFQLQQKDLSAPDLYNPWLFEKLKDFNYYFKSGNSRQYMLRYTKYFMKKMKEIYRKSSQPKKQ